MWEGSGELSLLIEKQLFDHDCRSVCFSRNCVFTIGITVTRVLVYSTLYSIFAASSISLGK